VVACVCVWGGGEEAKGQPVATTSVTCFFCGLSREPRVNSNPTHVWGRDLQRCMQNSKINSLVFLACGGDDAGFMLAVIGPRALRSFRPFTLQRFHHDPTENVQQANAKLNIFENAKPRKRMVMSCVLVIRSASPPPLSPPVRTDRFPSTLRAAASTLPASNAQL
jgi:hypothetical protein